MTSAASRRPNPLACPHCSGPVDVKSRHVEVAGSAVKVYCSEACRRGTVVQLVDSKLAIEEPPRRLRWVLAAGLAVGGTFVVLAHVFDDDRATSNPLPEAHAEAAPAIPAPPPPPKTAAAPVKSEAELRDEALVEELARDAWIHPLAGPQRKMPVNHVQAFGAARFGSPPPECISGHCGVDVVGNGWGEAVLAVHDGVIDWVNRGPNEEHGGIFVKIAHRDGSLFSWYFHLAAVPRWIQPGVKVKLGQVIGLLGDTGVKQSAPHLHFSMTVKPAKAERERYIDPEPLLAIWPLWIMDEGKLTGRLSTKAAPGVPARGLDYAQPRPVMKPRLEIPKAAAPLEEPKPVEEPKPAAEAPKPVAADDKLLN